MKALITGISGSGGSFLAEFLVNNTDVEVHGTSRWHSTTHNANLKLIKDKIFVHECDLTDLSSIFRIIKEVKPDYIFNLAAHANVKVCFDNPISVLQNNIMSTANLFEAIRMNNIDPVVQHCSTSEVYGQVKPENCPIKETHQLNPTNIYAVSKLAQEKIALSYCYSYNIPVVVTRAFTYINPRRHDIFSTSFALQIAKIEAGLEDILYHGNLESVRTLIDVRDAMEAYWIASNKCHNGEIYNVGGEDVATVGNILINLTELTHKEIKKQQDERFIRPVDVTLQIPDNTKFFNETGWKPKILLKDSLQWLLDSCRAKYV
jgi:GDP-4-dehydro-6-deoxy-D-mannose reductase